MHLTYDLLSYRPHPLNWEHLIPSTEAIKWFHFCCCCCCCSCYCCRHCCFCAFILKQLNVAATHFEFATAKNGVVLLLLATGCLPMQLLSKCARLLLFLLRFCCCYALMIVDEDVRCGNLIATMLLSLVALVLLLWLQSCESQANGQQQLCIGSVVACCALWQVAGWLASRQSLSLSDTKI